jgi:hypothetical protein
VSKPGKGIDIIRMLDEGFEPYEVAETLGCSQSYVRSVKFRFRHQAANPGYNRQRVQREEKMAPVAPNNLERATRLRRAGFSAFEIAQVIPSVVELA